MTPIKKDLNILITGAGAPGVYGVIKGLRNNGERRICLTGVDIDPHVASRYLLDSFHIVPKRTSPDFLPAVLNIAEKENIDIIFPIPTAELELFARARTFFPGREMIVSDPESLAVANNKARLYDHLQKAGFSCVAPYRRVTSIGELEQAVHALGYPQQPVCLRKEVSTGAQGFRILDAAADRAGHLLDQNPDSTLTTLENIVSILASMESFPGLLVQEYLPGPEYDVDVLARQGDCLSIIPRLNERMLWGMSLVCCCEEKPDLTGLTRRVMNTLNLSYINSLTFKYTRDGRPMILEINPRVPGSIVAAIASGVNMPYLAVKMALGEDIAIPAIRWGTRIIRYWDEVVVGPNVAYGAEPNHRPFMVPFHREEAERHE